MVTIRHAGHDDLGPVRDLIAAAGLPLDGLGAVPTDVLVASHEGEVVGVVALERHGPHGLLRSAAVVSERRGEGIGSALVDAAEGRARSLGLDGVYLLTETAEAFFARRGYRVLDRDEGPEPIASSVEWATACGESAIPMVLLSSGS